MEEEISPSVPAKPELRKARCLAWIRELELLPDRSAGTPSEHAAAQRVGAWLEEVCSATVTTQPVRAPIRSGYGLALHTGLAAGGCLVGGWPGVIAIAIALISFLGFRLINLYKVLPVVGSVNVAGTCGSGSPARRVVLSAHIDATQAGILFHPRLTDFFARRASKNVPSPKQDRKPPAGPNSLVRRLMLFGLLAAVPSALGAAGWFYTLLSLGAAGALLVASALGLQWALAGATPGANDNASAVAAMVDCATRVRSGLPADVELVVVGTGAEEVGCYGMRALLDANPQWSREDTVFLNFESVGSSNLHFIRTEGASRKTHYPPTSLQLAHQVTREKDAFRAVTAVDLLAGTDGNVPVNRGYQAWSLVSLEDNGVPRNYHRPDDRSEFVDMDTVILASDYGAALVRVWLEHHPSSAEERVVAQ